MPQIQVACRAVIDFEAPVVETGVVGFRLREALGGKVHLHFINPITDTGQNPTQGNPNEAKTLTYSVQVAPASSGVPGTFVDTSAALNLDAVVDETLGPGQDRSHTILLRPELDKFLLLVVSGGTRGQVIVEHDDILDRWYAPVGSPSDGSGRFDGTGGMTPA